MPTITEQLTQLTSDRDDFVDNLTTKGITGLTGDETFTELVPEVLNIPSGGGSMEIVDEMKLIDLGVTLHGAYYRPWSDKDYTQSEVDKVIDLIDKIGGSV